MVQNRRLLFDILVCNMKRVFVVIGLLFLLAGAAIPSYYFYNKYQEAKGLIAEGKVETKEVDALIDKINQLVDLPGDDVPTVATVSDKSKLASGWFFERAEDGDKVLIYPKANRAVLYRPSLGKVIEIGPVNTNNKEGDVKKTEEGENVAVENKVFRLALYNGTTEAGLTGKMESGLSEDFQVITKKNAKKTDYVESVVVVLDSNYQTLASELARKLGAKLVSELPEGEVLPTEDVYAVVILGSEYLP